MFRLHSLETCMTLRNVHMDFKAMSEMCEVDTATFYSYVESKARGNCYKLTHRRLRSSICTAFNCCKSWIYEPIFEKRKSGFTF